MNYKKKHYDKKLSASSILSNTPIVKRSNLERVEEENAKLRLQVEELLDEAHSLRIQVERLTEYDKWLERHYPSSKTLIEQQSKSKNFPHRPLISIILPVYNTDPYYLKSCIDSVFAQTYPNWELCIIDDASTNKETVATLKRYTNDHRVKLSVQKTNLHISKASNKAIEMAQGEFIALLDHDDYLWPNALYEIVKLLQQKPDADFIYTDEDKIDDEEKFSHHAPYFKPDWSPYLLKCINYITHFAVLRTSLVQEVGGFDDDKIGAQDWDLFLRVSEKTGKIYHIPTVLYSWRVHRLSTAMNLKAKPYALASQKKAINQHLSRIGLAASIKKGHHGSFWYPIPKIKRTYKVSVIIADTGKDFLAKSIESLRNNTLYTNYEIVIVSSRVDEFRQKNIFKNINLIEVKKPILNIYRAYNLAAKQAKGEFLVFISDELEVLTKKWLENMLSFAVQEKVSAVCGKTMFANHRIFDAGITLCRYEGKILTKRLGFSMNNKEADLLKANYTDVIREVSIVSDSNLMINKKKFLEVDGFDSRLKGFSTVDLCLRLVKKGYSNLYLSIVEFCVNDATRLAVENSILTFPLKVYQDKVIKFLKSTDPHYNVNFDCKRVNFALNVYYKEAKNKNS